MKKILKVAVFSLVVALPFVVSVSPMTLCVNPEVDFSIVRNTQTGELGVSSDDPWLILRQDILKAVNSKSGSEFDDGLFFLRGHIHRQDFGAFEERFLNLKEELKRRSSWDDSLVKTLRDLAVEDFALKAAEGELDQEASEAILDLLSDAIKDFGLQE